MNTLRQGISEAIIFLARKTCQRLKVPAIDGVRFLKCVERYSHQAEKGEISFFQAFRTLKEFDRGPLFEAMLFSGFQARYIDYSTELTFSEKEEFRRRLKLFFIGRQYSQLAPQMPGIPEKCRDASRVSSVSTESMSDFIKIVTEPSEMNYSTLPTFAYFEETLFLKGSLTTEEFVKIRELISTPRINKTIDFTNDSLNLEMVFTRAVSIQ